MWSTLLCYIQFDISLRQQQIMNIDVQPVKYNKVCIVAEIQFDSLSVSPNKKQVMK